MELESTWFDDEVLFVRRRDKQAARFFALFEWLFLLSAGKKRKGCQPSTAKTRRRLQYVPRRKTVEGSLKNRKPHAPRIIIAERNLLKAYGFFGLARLMN